MQDPNQFMTKVYEKLNETTQMLRSLVEVMNRSSENIEKFNSLIEDKIVVLSNDIKSLNEYLKIGDQKYNKNLTVLVLVFSISLCGTKTEKSLKTPKNIIFIISDGMGLAEMYATYTINGGKLAVDSAEYIGISKTYSKITLCTCCNLSPSPLYQYRPSSSACKKKSLLSIK